jgi:ubiquinone/menaquinone biosynthesis C-methylase UbiE
LTGLNSKQYKEAERQSWNSVAPAWQKWWKTIERGTEGVSRRLVELVEIKPGSRILDIATGIGEPALTAANHVGKSVTYWPQIFHHRCYLLLNKELSL